jgi:hypothetical protein
MILYQTQNNLIENYGVITFREIRRWEEKYISQQIRPAQDNWMMYQCLMNSISKEGKDKITIWKNQYSLLGYRSGNLLLKISMSIRISLDTYILMISNSDIMKSSYMCCYSLIALHLP